MRPLLGLNSRRGSKGGQIRGILASKKVELERWKGKLVNRGRFPGESWGGL